MASDWTRVTLADVSARPQYGAIAKGGDEYMGPLFIRQTDIVSGRIDWDSVPRCDLADAEVSKYSVRQGDILISRLGAGVGNAAVVDKTNDAVFAGYLVRFQPSPELADARFVGYQLQSKAWRDHVHGFRSGAAQPTLNAQQMGAFEFALPPLREQRAMTHLLGTLDDKIALNRQTNEILEVMARSLFKSWFIDFDPIRAKAERRAPSGMDAETAKLFPRELVESERGPIPKGWRASTLGAEAKRCGGTIQTGPFGSQLHASDYVAEGVPVVMPKDIAGRRVSTAGIARVREADAGRLSRHRLQTGDIVYSRRGDVERHALISDREAGWLCGTGCLLVRLGQHWGSSAFASFALDRPESRAWISQHAIGATMPNLNTGILAAVPMIVPSDDVLIAFARAVDPLQALMNTRSDENSALAQVRDELLPRLLSGELSVAGVTPISEAVA
jgi:type I restriction enzyme S subunit